MRKIFVLCAALCTFAFQHVASAQTAQKWFTTYYATWSMLPLGSTNFALPPWEIDFTGLTHIVLFDNGNVTQTAPYWAYMFGAPPARPSDTESDSVCVEYNGVANPGDGVHFTPFRDSLVTIAHRHGVKVVITIQAVNPTNLNYVTADSSRTQLFVNTLVAWAERKKFDGVELDWEGWASPLPSVDVISRFMRILYRRVHAMKTGLGAPGLIMVSAGSGQQSLYDPSQDYIVDQFNLQLYDYAYAWYGKISSNASWHISPLHRGTVDATFEGQAYDTRGPLQWVAAGHDAKRIGLGIPTYGYILRNVDALFQPMANPDYGSAHYQTIEALKTNGGVEEWDDVRKVRSIHGTALNNAGSVYYGSDGINAGQKFYAVGENPQSLQEKINWMSQNNFGGIMTYDFVSDLDPTQSIASGKRNPLQRVVANGLAAINGSTPPAVVPLGTFATSSTSLASGGGSVTLSWTSSNAATASIDQGVGTVALNGSTTINVTSTKTFTLTLTSPTGGMQQYQVTVTVASASQPSGTFTASAQSLGAGGGSVTLTWTSANASSASIDQGVGTVALSGSTTVSVTSTKTFTLTLAGSSGATATYSITVSVASSGSGGSSAPTKPIYTDNALTSPWSMDGSYSTSFDLASTEQVFKGTTSIKFTASGWAGINFRNGTWSSASAIDPSQYDSLHLAIHGGTSGASFALWLQDASGNGVGAQVKFSVPANTWTLESIPMSQFAAGTSPFAVVMLQLYQGTGVTFYIDDVSLVGKAVAVPSVTHSVALARGWNMISSYVKPAVTAIDSMMMSLAPSLTMVKNGSGQVYWPSNNINTIGAWNYQQGYMIYMDKAATLSVTGSSIQPEATPIALVQGWNLAPYVRTAAQSVSTATSSLGSALTIVKNNAGQVYWPAYSVNTLGQMTPGQAYQIYVTKASSLLYPANSLAKTNSADSVVAQVVPVHFPSLPGNTGDNETILIKGQGFADGDEIAVKTPSNLIAGTAVFSGGQALVTVWSDDIYTTNVVEGATAGQTLSFVRWSKLENAERTLNISRATDGITGADISPVISFTPNAIIVLQTAIPTSAPVEASVPTEFALEQNYPNPFNPSTVIRYALPSEGQVKLEIYSMLGERVGVLIDEHEQAGFHEVSFNAAGYASGAYFYILKSGSFTQTRRMILLK